MQTQGKLKLFMNLGFVFSEKKVSEGNAFGMCPFCMGKDKFYVNIETGQWDCKKCMKQGNTYTYMREWYREMASRPREEELRSLGEERGLPWERLFEEGIVWGELGESYIPACDARGEIMNLRMYKRGRGLRGMPGMDNQLFGIEKVGSGEDVYICEGEWDAIALRWFLEEEGMEDVTVVGTPGAGVWKDLWTHSMAGHRCVLCFDFDRPGRLGRARLYKKLKEGGVKEVEIIEWPEESGLPDGFDVRDFVKGWATGDLVLDDFLELIAEMPEEEGERSEDLRARVAEETPPELRVHSHEDLVNVYRKYLHVTDEMELALKIIHAVVCSIDVGGDPLWLHIVSPPGTAKTELLLPLDGYPGCHFASTLTPHSLVSGFALPGGEDPSLLPKLDGKTFVLKDFTEVLNMNRIAKDELYGTLRGAYDGSVVKRFGNGIVRDYNVRFNMVTGVTHAVFGERMASLGERFLMYHLVKGVGFDAREAIRSAIGNVGSEGTFRTYLQQATHFYVSSLSNRPVGVLEDQVVDRIIALSSFVGMLRAAVDRPIMHGMSDRISYRPQHEMGTRLAKQLTKLAFGLSRVLNTRSIGQEIYEILCRVALDTCVGLNLEAIAYIIEHGQSHVDEMHEALQLPSSTLRDQMEDMVMLGILWRERVPNPAGVGAPRVVYTATPIVKRYWSEAELSEQPAILELPGHRDLLRTIKRVRVVSKKASE